MSEKLCRSSWRPRRAFRRKKSPGANRAKANPGIECRGCSTLYVTQHALAESNTPWLNPETRFSRSSSRHDASRALPSTLGYRSRCTGTLTRSHPNRPEPGSIARRSASDAPAFNTSEKPSRGSLRGRSNALHCTNRGRGHALPSRRSDGKSRRSDRRSVPKCLNPVHDMIEAYDRFFGEGAGENFFTGPYLDILPNAMVTLITNRTD